MSASALDFAAWSALQRFYADYGRTLDAGDFGHWPDFFTEDECVATAEVAEVVGSPVERQMSFGGHGGEVSYSSEGCSYDLEGTSSSVDISRLSGDGLEGTTIEGRTLRIGVAKTD